MIVEETIACVEQMEKSHQDLREILTRDREEHREQMAQMMEVIMRLSRGKGIGDDVGTMNIIARIQGVTKGLVYNSYHPVGNTMPEVGTPHCLIPPMMNILQDTCPFTPAPIPSGGVFPYPYIPPPVVTTSPPVAQDEVNPGIVFTQSMLVQSSDDQKKWERKNLEFLMQPENRKTQQRSI